MKMHRVGEKEGGSNPAATTTTVEAKESPTAREAAEPNGIRDSNGNLLTIETLGRYLAAEVSLREASEERTSSALARYLKLTLLMAGINTLVAGVSVAVMVARADKVPTVVVNAPPAPVVTAPVLAPPASAPSLERAATLFTPLESSVAKPQSAPATTLSAPARPRLLGELPASPAKRTVDSDAVRPPRTVSKPRPSRTEALSKPVDDPSAIALSGVAERW